MTVSMAEALTQWGPLGIFAAVLLGFARWAIRREAARADRLEAEKNALNETVIERVVPLLVAATRAIEASTQVITALRGEADAYDTERTTPVGRRHARGGR